MMKFFNKKKIDSRDFSDYHPIVKTDPKHSVSEQYRKIHANLDLTDVDDTSQMILVSSINPSEGKSTVGINLATLYAQNEVKTLLIDLDLRKPRLHRGFDIINEKGISDIITHKLPFEEVTHSVMPNLDLLTSGSKISYPADIIQTKALKNLLDALKDKYQKIIIDSPPLGAVADARLIARYTDGILLVFESRKTNMNQIKSIIGELRENRINILGSVLTKVKQKDVDYYYSYYYEDQKKV